MSQIQNLLQVSDEERNAVLKNYNISEKEFFEKIATLREWYKKTGFPEDGKKYIQNTTVNHVIKISFIQHLQNIPPIVSGPIFPQRFSTSFLTLFH